MKTQLMKVDTALTLQEVWLELAMEKVSYSGVAPDAAIYALKVFGKKGSTSDIAVIQALRVCR